MEKNVFNINNYKNIDEAKANLREFVQSIILIGLSKANFFSKASFYGGTALRIFYGLNRYSEDLDFTLNEKNSNFSLQPYLNSIKNVAESYGLIMNVERIEKKIKTPIESAFAKMNTYQTFINLKMNEKFCNILHKDEILKVKFEIDCEPPLGFNIESKWLISPEFATVNVLDIESLFAGKLHAILCRNYNNNIKGRDYYDFLFYISKNTKPNMIYLKNKLIESNKINKTDNFDLIFLKSMLYDRFNNVNFNQVYSDAKKFVFENEDLSYYCKELFIDCIDKLKI